MNKSDVICSDTIKKRQIKSQNIQIRLFQRENGLNCFKQSSMDTNRQFYQCIFPNLTIINVEKPSGFLRKFTPDGKNLIAFSFDQTSLEVYKFNGTSAVGDLLSLCEMDIVPNENNGKYFQIRDTIFNKLFTIKYSINVAPNTSLKQLNRECSLFTKDSQFVIIGAAQLVPEESRPSFYDIYTTNEGISANSRCNLEDYTLYLVNLEKGMVSDHINFSTDRIFLSHNQGIYLFNNKFAVLSVFHQTIYLYEIFNGKFILIQKIGRFCNIKDYDLYRSVYPNTKFRPHKEATINSLKHRFLTFMFRKAEKRKTTDGDAYELRKFYQFFDHYKNLRMWKMQLLDENHLLIKYASEEVVSLIVPEPNSHPAFFIFYNIPSSKILQVYDNTSPDLLKSFENFSDVFRNAPTMNIYGNFLQKKCKQAIISARGGGNIEATKRMLAQLPIAAQSFSYSPYLDMNLFSYDDKYISIMERPKTCGEHQSIRFFDRDSGIFKFRIYPGLQSKIPSSNSITRRLVAFTFHPYEPFAISVQRCNNEYIVNFHIRSTAIMGKKS